MSRDHGDVGDPRGTPTIHPIRSHSSQFGVGFRDAPLSETGIYPCFAFGFSDYQINRSPDSSASPCLRGGCSVSAFQLSDLEGGTPRVHPIHPRLA